MSDRPADPPRTAAQRYVAWLARHAWPVVLIAALVLAASGYLAAFHLPLRADFSHLLPQDAQSVKDLRRLEARIAAQDSVLVLVTSPDPELTATIAEDLAARIRALPPALVQRVESDDAETRAFLRAHRHLFVPYDDLVAARDALDARIEKAKQDANPLFVRLDDEDAAAEAEAASRRLEELRAKRDEAEAKLARSGHVSADGTIHLLVVRTGFGKTDAGRGAELIDALGAARAAALAPPGRQAAKIGFAAGVASSVAEHNALVRGMLLSSVVTAILVAAVLAWYFRSVRLLALLSIALVVGTTASFGVAALTVGHLNAATAFLGAIIAGNGVNYGILLVARFLEERRNGDHEDAMARAITGTLKPTIVASLGASIAYGSLAATSFRGFADFAVIGGVGMLLCWLASYTLLPALVLRWGTRTKVHTEDSVIGAWLARLLGFRRPAYVLAWSLVVAAGASWVTYRYIVEDPFEYDMTQLRSNGAEAVEVRAWVKLSDDTFGRGISGQTYVAVDSIDEVDDVVAALRKVDAGAPEDRRTIGVIRSILDVLPDRQTDKLAVLGEIRALLDDDALEALSDDERAEIAALRPPDDLAAITPDTLPEELAAKLREKDGRVGLMIGVRPDTRLDEWNGRDLIRFASAVREIDLGEGRKITTSGASVIYADIVATIRKDGPIVVAVAGLCIVVMVLLVVGRDARAVAVVVATALGSLLLVAVCALIGLQVTFLDFVALPITLGLGVDYAINLAHRQHKDDDDDDPAVALRTSGPAVVMCSLTTVIGYGSLLVSENLAIRGFGLASLIGEVCCLLTALIVVPAVIGLGRGLRPRGVDRLAEVALGEAPPVAR